VRMNYVLPASLEDAPEVAMTTRDDEPDVQALIREIAKTGADPDWVRECVLIEQDAIAAAAKAGSRTHLRLVPRMSATDDAPSRGTWRLDEARRLTVAGASRDGLGAVCQLTASGLDFSYRSNVSRGRLKDGDLDPWPTRPLRFGS
jgi:hypothetical protein